MRSTQETMSAKNICPTCGAALAPRVAGDQCPKCLLRLAWADRTTQPAPETKWAQHASNGVDAPVLDDEQVFGDYRLESEIARGGMGVVYRARQVSLGRAVALKMIATGQFASPSLVQRFQVEAGAAARLDHPNIVPIYEIGQHRRQVYYSMKLVPGGNLAQWNAKCGVRDAAWQRRAAALLIKIAQAIHYAHQHGVLHRDLKPANILMETADSPRVTDFGLAKVIEDESGLTLSTATLGTPAYMAPEQAAGRAREVSTAADIYSLGAILYELLTGRTPFQAPSALETMRLVLEQEPARPRALNPAVAADLETICLKCLEKEPAKRYSTAQELAGDVERFLQDEPITARPVTRVERTWRWCRRKPVIAGLVLTVVLAFAFGLFGVLWQWRRADFNANNEARQRLRAEVGERAARQNQYVADMNLVKQVWEEGNLKRAQELLRGYIPRADERDLRGFEWRYLLNLCQDESLHTIPSNTDDPVWRLASLPDLHSVAACGEKTIRMLDPISGAEMQSFSYPGAEEKNTRPVIALASQATNILAAHQADGVVGLWDLTDKALLMTFRPFTNAAGSLAISPDGKRLATAEHPSQGRALEVWDISARPNPPRLMWSQLCYRSPSIMRFSPDGQTLVGDQSPGGGICAFDARTGHKLKSFPKESVGTMLDLAFSPDGKLLASSGNQGRILVWNFTNRTVACSFDGNFGRVFSLAFSPDGLRLVSGCADGTVRMWDVPSGTTSGMFRDPHAGEVLSAVFTSDGKSIVSSTHAELKIWKAELPQRVATLETDQQWGGPPAISPDNRWLVTVGITNWGRGLAVASSARVWDLGSHQEKFQLALKPQEAVPPVFSPDGRFLVLGSEGPEDVFGVWDTTLWEKATAPMEPLIWLTNKFEACSIAFSPDGKILAAAGLCFHPEKPSGSTNRLAFWEVGSWRKLNVLANAGAGANEWEAAATAAFSNDGRLLAVGHRDGTVRLWDFKEQRLLKELDGQKGSGSGFGASVKFSADSHWLASVAYGGRDLFLYDLKDPEHPRLVLAERAHSGNCWSAAFAPDNRSLVSSGNDGLIKFWNLESLTVALTLEHSYGPGVFISFSPDGNLLASQDAHGTIKVWPAPSFERITQKEMQRK